MALRAPDKTHSHSHPEHETPLQFHIKRCFNAIFRPEIRLETRLPWGLAEFSKLYAVAVVYYLVASMIPIILMFIGLLIALRFAPEQVAHLIVTEDGHPNIHIVLGTTVVAFVTGFGAELHYINKQLRKTGHSLTEVIGLNLKTLNGSWLIAFMYAFLGLGAGILIQTALGWLPMPKPHQTTADLAASLDSGGMVGFTILAALLAPFFEEIIFRGFVFNAFRNIFREGRIFKLLGESQRLADYAAVGFSALLFAGAHMDATAFLQLLAVGVVLAEIYRRSGSLVCPMLMHSFNNIIATAGIVFSAMK